MKPVVEMKGLSDYLIPTKVLREALQLIEIKEGPGSAVSLQYLLATFFPSAVRQFSQNFNDQFTKGYIQGRRDEKDGH